MTQKPSSLAIAQRYPVPIVLCGSDYQTWSQPDPPLDVDHWLVALADSYFELNEKLLKLRFIGS